MNFSMRSRVSGRLIGPSITTRTEDTSIMTRKAPGKSHREWHQPHRANRDVPDEESAVKWFEAIRWNDGRHCGHCGSTEAKPVPNAKPMPYWCKECRSYFSVRTGTTMEKSRLPLRKWAFAVYLCHQPQGRVQHEAAPRPEDHAEDGMVHAPPTPRGVGRKRPLSRSSARSR